MADETAPETVVAPATPETTPATAEDTAASVAAARDLLIAQGHQVLDSSAFHSIKTTAAAKAEAKLVEAQANLDAAKAENASLAEYKAGIENKGKSENELHTEQRRAWQAKDVESATALSAANEQLAQAQASLARERVQNRTAVLMPGATNPEAAQMWADRHIGKMLSTDDAGQLVWTDPTGTPHIGIAAEKLVSEWWSQEGQKFLHAANVPGPSTAGAASAPAPKSDKFVQDSTKTFEENLRLAAAYDANKLRAS